ncbi:indolepyruvate oxidoreductase subunit beta [Mangrovibacterium marinum]|uniref:Indolepyruvate ferredoxin oxidoreductase beta subunit n=1 Tax=Mangrovibacterium marinum TaxID=1639118 RepID=A0A2T5BRV3_9BACT|nr:indolepyruvate oxidoreductase subunit beta [Mangrovibacterium marinum]PTN02049.1 indolepyruvate ferredoxin oxidoreductase beta subunit [Mangrovibacterium marinum]
MKKDIILAGVGGQGILSVAAILSNAAMLEGLWVKQAETHGMSQRGGAVVAHLRLADHEVCADLIHHGQADILLGLEPMEALRQLPFLHTYGVLISNMEPYLNLPNYPPVEELWTEIKRLPRHILVDGGVITHQLCNPKALNMIMLGALSDYIPLQADSLKTGICELFRTKGEQLVQQNLEAFDAGRAFVAKQPAV